MTRGKQTAAIAVAGAVALASGAYALGTQADDGSAVAAKNSSGTARAYGPPRGGPPRLDALADRLGVDEAKLRSALEDIAKAHRDDFAQKLADALGIPRAKVDAAFAKLRAQRPKHDERHRDFAQALASKLGLSLAKVQAALDKQRDRHHDPQALADALGVSAAKLRQAFADLWRGHRRHERFRGPGPRGDALAKALGVTPAQLRAAFEKLRAAHDDLRDTFAAELAQRLNLDPAKVKAALDDMAPFGRRHP
jgi:DNA-binding transcriptional MerR regulator